MIAEVLDQQQGEHAGELGGAPARIAVGGDSAGADLADPRISPGRSADLSGLPATVLAVAEYDPLRDQGTAYAEALRAASVPVSVQPGRGLIHGCFDMRGVTAAARDEFERVLHGVREARAITTAGPAATPEPGRAARAWCGPSRRS